MDGVQTAVSPGGDALAGLFTQFAMTVVVAVVAVWLFASAVVLARHIQAWRRV